METGPGDGSRQRETLPSFSHLDFGKAKMEGTHYHQRNPSMAPLSMSSTVPISPTSMYPGPPPPYPNHISSSTGSVPSFTGLISPPDSRRTSGDDKEGPPPQRSSLHSPQSLPSLKEALNSDQPLPYDAPAPTSTLPQSNPPSSVVSPTTPIPRSFPHDNHPSQRSQSQGSLQFPTQGQLPPPGHPTQTQYAPQEVPSAPHSNFTRNHSLPSLSSIRPVHHTAPPQQTSPQYDPNTIPGASHFPYPGFQQQFNAPQPPPLGHPPGPYGNQAGFSPRTESTYVRKVDNRQVEEARAIGKTEGEKYGHSVKRHLEIYDLEASFREIIAISSAIYNFSSRYNERAQESQRSAGLSPDLIEVDEMLKQSRQTCELFEHIKDVLQAQQNVPDHRAHESGFKSSTDFDMEDNSVFHDDMKNHGLMGPDPKKRRGVGLRLVPIGAGDSTNSFTLESGTPR
ncbi:hypothetical protein GP486_007560 [Trichoglossum hirsutum]|uniref:Uncharacterized protein n=1 Tax=Trichoglossum hirsutum TaxID=265104 RepID=A0A9P8IHD3_9PEZI|nr:hypothetical protein GP486_007560 [Trichoglossum hirsutum]